MDILTLISSGPEKISSDPIGSPISSGHVVSTHPSWNVWDSTKLGAMQECRRKGFFQNILGWETEEKNHDLVFGEAGHIAKAYLLENGYTIDIITKAYELFLERYRKDYSEVTDNDFSPKTPERMQDALVAYAVQNRGERFSVLYSEVADKVMIDKDTYMYFRIDAVLENDEGIWARESKFTKWKPYKYSWGDTWILQIQPGTYNHVLRCIAGDRHVRGVEMDGAFFYKDRVEHERSWVSMTDEDIEAWRFTVLRLIRDIEEDMKILKTESPSQAAMYSFPMNGKSCFNYNKRCQFYNLCTSRANPLRIVEENEGNPPSGFIRKYWDPTKVEDRFQPLKEGERK